MSDKPQVVQSIEKSIAIWEEQQVELERQHDDKQTRLSVQKEIIEKAKAEISRIEKSTRDDSEIKADQYKAERVKNELQELLSTATGDGNNGYLDFNYQTWANLPIDEELIAIYCCEMISQGSVSSLRLDFSGECPPEMKTAFLDAIQSPDSNVVKIDIMGLEDYLCGDQKFYDVLFSAMKKFDGPTIWTFLDKDMDKDPDERSDKGLIKELCKIASDPKSGIARLSFPKEAYIHHLEDGTPPIRDILTNKDFCLLLFDLRDTLVLAGREPCSAIANLFKNGSFISTPASNLIMQHHPMLIALHTMMHDDAKELSASCFLQKVEEISGKKLPLSITRGHAYFHERRRKKLQATPDSSGQGLSQAVVS